MNWEWITQIICPRYEKTLTFLFKVVPSQLNIYSSRRLFVSGLTDVAIGSTVFRLLRSLSSLTPRIQVPLRPALICSKEIVRRLGTVSRTICCLLL